MVLIWQQCCYPLLSETAKKSIIRTAFSKAIRLAVSHNLESLATALMTGGWRLSYQAAFLAMTEGFDTALHARHDINVALYIIDSNQYETIKGIAVGLGFR